jgi:hypothetical protein
MMNLAGQNQIFYRMLEFNRNLISTSFNTMINVQNQAGKLMDLVMYQTQWSTEKWKQILSESNRLYRESTQNITFNLDNNLKKLENYLIKK